MKRFALIVNWWVQRIQPTLEALNVQSNDPTAYLKPAIKTSFGHPVAE